MEMVIIRVKQRAI